MCGILGALLGAFSLRKHHGPLVKTEHGSTRVQLKAALYRHMKAQRRDAMQSVLYKRFPCVRVEGIMTRFEDTLLPPPPPLLSSQGRGAHRGEG